jgi:hypothetical protein
VMLPPDKTSCPRHVASIQNPVVAFAIRAHAGERAGLDTRRRDPLVRCTGPEGEECSDGGRGRRRSRCPLIRW